MLFKPNIIDIRVISYYIGKICTGWGLLMLIPFFVSILLNEYNEVINFSIGFLICVIVGYVLIFAGQFSSTLSVVQGMIIVALSWFVCMFLGAIPYFLSGHFLSYLDCCFDLMSGLATAGFSLIQDVDHASYSLNLWRFIVPYVGGQGIILIAVTVLIRISGIYGMYAGEGRDEKILPNISQTARMIWLISILYTSIGIIVLWIGGITVGLSPLRAFWHSFCLVVSSWSTSGFSPQSTSIIYYHSFTIEIITWFVFFLGAINFSIHYTLITGNRKEIYENIEIRVLFACFFILLIIILNGLRQSNNYSTLSAFFWNAVYILGSAHTTTGHSILYPCQFVTQWGSLTMFALTIAMGIGGNACSTAGGIKNLRIGILVKEMILSVTQVVLPKSAIFKPKFHHIKDILLEDKMVRATAFIIFCYLLTFAIGTLVGLWYGYPLSQALFESVSAATGTGLSCGIVCPQMPSFLKIVYIIEMWMGRLEFISVFLLVGFLVAIPKESMSWCFSKKKL
ncbi:MAG: potassium transporter TrkG [bacterium]